MKQKSVFARFAISVILLRQTLLIRIILFQTINQGGENNFLAAVSLFIHSSVRRNMPLRRRTGRAASRGNFSSYSICYFPVSIRIPVKNLRYIHGCPDIYGNAFPFSACCPAIG